MIGTEPDDDKSTFALDVADVISDDDVNDGDERDPFDREDSAHIVLVRRRYRWR